MTEQIADVQPVRPYFVPEGIDFETLPKPVQLAFEEIIFPAYNDLVLGAKSSLERITAVRLVFLMSLEVLDQFAIGRAMNFTQTEKDAADGEELDKQFRRYMKISSSSQAASMFLMKLQTLRFRLVGAQAPWPLV